MLKIRVVAFALLLCVHGMGLAEPAPDEKTGLKVGEKAPDFTLKDQTGQERTLAKLLKDKPVAMVFYRSASW